MQLDKSTILVRQDIVEEKKLNFYTNFVYFIVLASLVVFRICGHFGLFSFLGPYGSYILNAFVQIGIIFLLPFTLIKLFTKSKTKEVFQFYCFKKVSWKVVLVSFILGFVVFFLNVYVSNFFNNLIALFGYKHTSSSGSDITGTWWGLLLNLFCTAVLPAFCEESLHRGLLMNGNSMFGMKKSVLISGFLFGLLHLNIEQFFYASIIGLFLGYLCWGCSSIYPCIIVHFMNNAMSVFFSFASARGWSVGKFFENIAYFLTQNQLLGFVLFFLMLALLVFVALELTKYLIRESFNYNFKKRQTELAGLAMREAYFKQIEDIKGNKIERNDGISQDSMLIVDVNEFLEFVNRNIHAIMRKTDGLDNTQEKFKMQNRSKIFLYGAIVLGAIVTIMTFIWGIL